MAVIEFSADSDEQALYSRAEKFINEIGDFNITRRVRCTSIYVEGRKDVA